MAWITDFYESALGKKVVMAVTGVFIFGWVTMHMIGNLKIYLGAEALNHYGEWLRTMGYPLLPHTVALWIARLLLIAAVWFHIQSAWQLTLINRKARPQPYKKKTNSEADYAALTMRWSGVLLLLFIVYHLADLTWGWHTIHPNFQEGKPYENIQASFSMLPVALFYIVAQICLGLHLYHGVWSMFQSVGLNNPKFNAWRRNFATAFALIVSLANISFPIAVMMGFVR